MADLSLEFATEQGLGPVLGRVRLDGDLALSDGGRARATLLLSKTGVWLVAARSRSVGLTVDLLTRGDLRLESGRIRDRLCFGREALTIPSGRRHAVERLIALGRLSPPGHGLAVPLKTSRLIRAPDELGRAWLDREVGTDEILICWLPGSNTTLLNSQLLGDVQSRPHLFLTDRRAAIVAWSNVADVTYAALTAHTVQALAREQKAELIAPNASFLSRRADADATRDAFDLIALREPKARLLEAARRIWLDREHDREAGLRSLDLLHGAIERGSEPARCARLLLIAEHNQAAAAIDDAELARALDGDRLTPDALATLWESWGFSRESGSSLVTRLIDVGGPALPFALALQQRIHELPGIDDEAARDELRLAAFAVNTRLSGSAKASTRDRALQALLNVHGLCETHADLPTSLPATEALPPQLIEGVLRHPLARAHGSLVEGVQKLIALAPEPDQLALSDYCEALSENEQPAATRALSAARRAFALPTLYAYVSRGKKSIGLRGYEGKTPYILLGSAHLDSGSPYFMNERELEFAFGAEALHLKLGHTRVTSNDVWAGAFAHTKEGIEILLGLLPLVKGIPLGAGVTKLLERIPEPALRRALEVILRFESGRRKLATTSSAQSALSLVNENLVAAQRLMQMSADRAGLVLCGGLRASVRGLLLSRPDYLELLQAMERDGIVQVLASDAGSLKMRADLLVRIAALIDFYAGDDYLTLRRALCGAAAQEAEL